MPARKTLENRHKMATETRSCCGQEMAEIVTRMDRLGVLFPTWFRAGWYCFKCRAWVEAKGREKLLEKQKK